MVGSPPAGIVVVGTTVVVGPIVVLVVVEVDEEVEVVVEVDEEVVEVVVVWSGRVQLITNVGLRVEAAPEFKELYETDFEPPAEGALTT
jgi:hypothetical protein